MIGRGTLRKQPAEERAGFDAFELRLGDLMRGERATLGKSLLDVQRELKIKVAYIAAIEGADPSAFDTPGFIAGYVRSYARYLNMDPDWAFDTFCRESGFSTAHGMSAAASVVRPEGRAAPAAPAPAPKSGLGSGAGSGLGSGRGAGGAGRELFAVGSPLALGGGLLGSVEPRAVGSVLVLAALLAGLGYGGWTVLREVQQVTFAPVEQPPTIVAELDPLAGGAAMDGARDAPLIASIQTPSPEALDRLYRPEALEVPVLVPRDGPIASLDPGAVGTLAGPQGAPARPVTVAQATAPQATMGPPAPSTLGATALAGSGVGGSDLGGSDLGGSGVAGVDEALAAAIGAAAPADPSGVQVTAEPPPPVQLVAVREAWVRVKAPDGSVLFEGILNPGDTFDVPAFAEAPTLRIGESGAVYMALNGVPYGPVGPDGAVSSNVALSAQAIAANYQPADPSGNERLAEFAAVASAAQAGAAPPQPPVIAPAAPEAVPFE